MSSFNCFKVFIFILFLPLFSIGQTYTVEIRAYEVGSSGYYTDGKGWSSFRIENDKLKWCRTEGAANRSWPVDYWVGNIKKTYPDSIIHFTLITHNERKAGSDNCTAQATSDITTEKPDAYEFSSSHRISLHNLNAGVWHDLGGFRNQVGNVSSWVKLKVRYSIPKPDTVVFETPLNNCGNEIQTLTTNLTTFGDQDELKYLYEYWMGDSIEDINPEWQNCINGCSGSGAPCYEKCDQFPMRKMKQNWNYLNYGIEKRQAKFKPEDLFPFYLGEEEVNFTRNFTIYFRVNIYTGTYYTDKMDVLYSSKVFSHNFFPSPPIVDISKITTTTTCSERSTAEIKVIGVESLTSNYRYILIEGDNPLPCLPEPQAKNPRSCFGKTMIESNLVTKSDFTIDSVGYSENGYTLRLTNPGDSLGACFNSYHIATVPRFDEVKALITNQNISCQDFNDGKITFSSTGGTGITTFNILKTEEVFQKNLQFGEINNLTPAIYSVVTQNFCDTIVNHITITEPSRVISEITTNNTSCINPGNGQVSVTTSQSSDLYNYYLYNKTSIQDSLLISNVNDQGKNWQLGNLKAGNYHLIVKDAQRDFCPGSNKFFSISNPPSLSITDIKKTEVECAGAATGGLIVTPSGGVNKYLFQIKQTAADTPIENTTGTFENLNSGNYSVILKSGVEGCLDSYSHPEEIIITPPELIKISSTHTDISCFEFNDGTIEAKVEGGKGNFNYTWEKQIANEWNTLSEKGLALKNLLPGTYRMKATDIASCSMVSDLIEIVEPTLLEIPKVYESRPDCKGEKVTFDPEVKGGIAPYQLYYSKDAGNTYLPFTKDSILYLGTYKIKASDRNNCVASYAKDNEVKLNSLVVEKEVTPVCYKSSNGSISLSPSGGHPPYFYSKDNGSSFQNNNEFKGLLPGNYSMVVKDEFGCITDFTLDIIQKQDKPEINFLVASRDNEQDTLIIAEISQPKPDSLFWTFDPNAIVVDPNKDMPSIRFNEEGKYYISMTAYFDGCEYTLTKQVTVKPFDPNAGPAPLPGVRPIDQVLVSPNPNDGNFNLKVKLIKKQNLIVTIIDMLGGEQYRKLWDYIDEVDERIEIPTINSGTFLIRLVTENDAREVKIIVKK